MSLYEGEIGDAIIEAIQDRGGLMTKEDLVGGYSSRSARPVVLLQLELTQWGRGHRVRTRRTLKSPLKPLT